MAFANLAAWLWAALGGGGGRFCPHSWERNVGHLPLSDLGTGASAVGWCPLLSACLKEDRGGSLTHRREAPRALEKRAGAGHSDAPWPLPGRRGNRAVLLQAGSGKPLCGPLARSRKQGPACGKQFPVSERLRLPSVLPGRPSPTPTHAHSPGSWGLQIRKDILETKMGCGRTVGLLSAGGEGRELPSPRRLPCRSRGGGGWAWGCWRNRGQKGCWLAVGPRPRHQPCLQGWGEVRLRSPTVMTRAALGYLGAGADSHREPDRCPGTPGHVREAW